MSAYLTCQICGRTVEVPGIISLEEMVECDQCKSTFPAGMGYQDGSEL